MSSPSKNSETEETVSFADYESDSECDYGCDGWDNDCKILEFQLQANDKIVYDGCSKDHKEPKLKRQKVSPHIRQDLFESKFLKNFHNSFISNQRFKDSNVELFSDPFKLCIVENFLEESFFTQKLRNEFNEIDWNTRTMDLYEFFQSEDLDNIDNMFIKLIYNFLKEDVRKWVADLTGLNLTHTSATCSLYTNTDYLLVHDDQRDDRVVAFVLYFVRNRGWSCEKGGTLQLLDKDNTGQPFNVVKEIFPRNNQLVFFPVTDHSYHQVDEVISLEDCRMSVNGWFHTKTPLRYQTLKFHPEPNGIFDSPKIVPKDVDIDLETWISKDYLESATTKEIQQFIEENSEISLNKFLRQEPLNNIVEVLNNEGLKWTRLGPPNQLNYEILRFEDFPLVLDRLVSLFQSKQMFQLLHNLTDLDLRLMRFELQRWTPGCYMLFVDYDWKQELDLTIYFGCKNSGDVIGCRTQYVNIEDPIQYALSTLEPKENNLNIVYRDTAKFTKYYSTQSKCKCFYALTCTYTE